MNYKILFFIIIIFLNGCVSPIQKKEIISTTIKEEFVNKGFALIYTDSIYKKKIVNGKIDKRSLIIFQKNLRKDTTVRVTNLLNSKYIVAKVGKKTNYPYFFNSVISERISKELEIDILEPYIEIKEINEISSFIAKKAKTFEQEKKVATKAPVDDIVIKDLSGNNKKKDLAKKQKFNYIIKIADFYFEKSANLMKSRILNESSIKKVYISKISNTQFRVFLGPYINLNSLKKSFNAINVLQFDSIEIIRN